MEWKMLINIPKSEIEVGSYFAVNNVIYQIMYDDYKKEYFLILDNGRIIASDFTDLEVMMKEMFDEDLIFPVKPIMIKEDTMIFDIYSQEQIENAGIKHNINDLNITEFDIRLIEEIVEELLDDEDDGEYYE